MVMREKMSSLGFAYSTGVLLTLSLGPVESDSITASDLEAERYSLYTLGVLVKASGYQYSLTPEDALEAVPEH